MPSAIIISPSLNTEAVEFGFEKSNCKVTVDSVGLGTEVKVGLGTEVMVGLGIGVDVEARVDVGLEMGMDVGVGEGGVQDVNNIVARIAIVPPNI